MKNARFSRPRIVLAVASVAWTGLAVVAGCTETVVVDPANNGPEGTLALPTVPSPPGPPAPGPAPERDGGRTTPDSATPRDAAVPDTAVPDSSTTPDTSVPDSATTPDTSTGGATLPNLDEVVISEVMYDPSTAEPATEWIELTNTTAAPKILNGLTLTTPGGGSFTFPATPSLVVAPGAYVVIAQNRLSATTALVPATTIVAEYGAALGSLSNGTTGGVSLSNAGTVIARAPYAGFFPSPQGASIQLKTLTFAAAGTAANWCVSGTAFAIGGDKGTPGAASDCP